MPSLAARSQAIWNSIRQSPTQLPTIHAIPGDHTDEEPENHEAFQQDVHYFSVVVNEMYLKESRVWYTTYDPMVFVLPEFIYDTREEAVPYIAGGPTMISKYGQELPEGMIFSNTHITGPHPYRGGAFNLSVILCELQRDNYARKLLQVVGSTAEALSFAIPLSQYIKVAGAILDGIESLFGSQNTRPLIGMRKVFDSNDFKPGYFVIIDKAESELNLHSLGVRNHQLVYGENSIKAKPFREANFVLYSIKQTKKRDDDRLLPFYPKYQEVLVDAGKPGRKEWQATKVKMTALVLEMLASPDLTFGHAQLLKKLYVDRMVEIHDAAEDASTLGPARTLEKQGHGIGAGMRGTDSIPERGRGKNVSEGAQLQDVLKILDL